MSEVKKLNINITDENISLAAQELYRLAQCPADTFDLNQQLDIVRNAVGQHLYGAQRLQCHDNPAVAIEAPPFDCSVEDIVQQAAALLRQTGKIIIAQHFSEDSGITYRYSCPVADDESVY